MFFYGPQIWHWISQSSRGCKERVWIASAYVTEKRLLRLSELFDVKQLDKCIVVRWQLSDLLDGSSTLKSYEVAKENGWRFFVNLDLHAKAYIFDNSCALGSANLTEKGMAGFTPPGNREVLAHVTDYVSLIDWYNELITFSTEIDDELFEKISAVVCKNSISQDKLHINSDEYGDLFKREVLFGKDHNLYTHDLFWTSNTQKVFRGISHESTDRDVEHDLSIMGLHSFSDHAIMGTRFIGTKAFKWLLNTVDDQSYFGELASKLHSSLMDDPTPYRKDVKLLLNNLLGWTSAYGTEYFIIDQPNISQRVSRK
ncbi:phospholipase D family protein [Sedimenticola selenatireducens]|uniref:phospholipase D family protein n=1 Tax=Sedimenticola selenatireducens TaxID=191960 RepID=UPI002AAC3782|nr:phospholipase D family protein [Sedimenticola selenatireducens]